MTAIDMYRSLLRAVHEFLEDAFSIAANYAHVVSSEDMGIQQLLRGRALLATTNWAGRTGVSEMPPLGPRGDLKAWSHRATVDLSALQRYGQAVYAATDEYLASLAPEALSHPVDLRAWGLGVGSVLLVLTVLLGNASMHCGEISCLKGVQGLKGYPI
jgi:hypothetical protein